MCRKESHNLRNFCNATQLQVKPDVGLLGMVKVEAFIVQDPLAFICLKALLIPNVLTSVSLYMVLLRDLE